MISKVGLKKKSLDILPFEVIPEKGEGVLKPSAIVEKRLQWPM